MISFVRTLLLAAVGCFLTGSLQAQDAAGWIEELRELRKTVDLQSKRIEVLSQQVARLTAVLEGKNAPASSPPNPAPGNPSPAPAAATEEFAPPAPGAKPEVGLPKHVIVKGETLTSVAKHYNITLPELLKANPSINDRKLQIGQSISLPPNATPKNPEATSTEKANP